MMKRLLLTALTVPFLLTMLGCVEQDAATENNTTGRALYTERLDLEANCYSDVVRAGKRIYVSDTRGRTVVFAAGRTFQLIARNDLGEYFGRALTMADNRIYIQGQKHLYCIGNK